MIYGMYVSAAGAMANSYRQDVVANNLANVDTVGYKRDLAMFRSRMTAAQESGASRYSSSLLEGIGGGVFSLPTYTDFSPANLEQREDPYSLAISGKGFFQVQGEGGLGYTRDGRFALNEENQLVTFSGKLPVLNDQGQAIVIDRNQDFIVSESGVISQNGQEVAKLAICDFSELQSLRKKGDNLYVDSSGQTPLKSTSGVKQGYLEGSGADATQNLVDLIHTQRMLQMNLNMLKIQDQTLGQAVARLGMIT